MIEPRVLDCELSFWICRLDDLSSDPRRAFAPQLSPLRPLGRSLYSGSQTTSERPTRPPGAAPGVCSWTQLAHPESRALGLSGLGCRHPCLREQPHFSVSPRRSGSRDGLFSVEPRVPSIQYLTCHWGSRNICGINKRRVSERHVGNVFCA